MLLETAAVGGGLAIGVSVYQKKKQTLSGWLKKIRELIAQVKRNLSSDTRNQQLLALSSDAEIAKREQKSQNLSHQLKVSLVTTGIASAGGLFYAPLGWFSLPGIVYTSKDMTNDAYQAFVQHRKINIDSLILIGNILLLVGGHFFWCCISILLYVINHKLLHTIRDNAKSSLVDVFRQQPQFAWVLQDGTERKVAVADLTPEAIVIVGAGEVIPVDGEIIQGTAAVDQHILTGESQPAEKAPGDTVFAATVLLSGKIQVRVGHLGTQTTAAQIGQMLQQTADTKTQRQLQVEAFSDKTVVPTLIGSVAAMPFAGTLGAVAILQSHFKHRMSIVSAIGLMNYLNLAAHQGMLIKSGDVLEKLRRVDTVVFDKTGTLTEEIPEIGTIHLCTDITEDTVLRYAAAAEGKQTHPIARAILQAAQTRQLTIPETEDAAYRVGFGVSVTLNQQAVHVGSMRFMRSLEMDLPTELEAAYADSSDLGHGMVLLAIGEQLVAGIELRPRIRSEAKAMIAGLRQRGIRKTCIISGDQVQPTRYLANELGVDDYFAEVLPEQKAERIAELQQAGHVVCFVGDGINDCIAMQQADVSVSLGDASTVAVDTAEVILLENQIHQLGDLLDLSTAFMSRAQVSYSIIAIPSVIAVGGVFFLGFGLTPVMLLPQIGLMVGVLYSMYPLLKQNLDQE